jgi:hypothetical protein
MKISGWKKMYGMVLVLFLGACSSEIDPDPSAVGYTYFPLEVGAYIDYTVTETTYAPGSPGITEQYFLRRKVVDTFVSENGLETYVIHRFRRIAPGDPWQFLDTWSARRESIRGVTIEGTTPFLSLSFPVRRGQRWDGNVLNTAQSDTYTIDSLGFQYTIPGVGSGPALTVVQEDLLDFVIEEQDQRYEIYMENVGLVERGVRQLDLCSGSGCNASGIVSGRIYLQKVIDYGVE